MPSSSASSAFPDTTRVLPIRAVRIRGPRLMEHLEPVVDCPRDGVPLALDACLKCDLCGCLHTSPSGQTTAIVCGFRTEAGAEATNAEGKEPA